jgi:hypothetical protein
MRALAGALLLAVGLAQGARAEGTRVTFHTRTFDIGVPLASLTPMTDAIPVTHIGWLKPMFAADPLFAGRSLLIELMQGPQRTFRSMNPPGVRFDEPGGVPAVAQVPGFTELADGPEPRSGVMVQLLPQAPGAGYQVTCQVIGGQVATCEIDAAYGPDPMIELVSMFYVTRPFASDAAAFPALVARMRAVAACLDVTDEGGGLRRDGGGHPDPAACQAPALMM